MRHMMVLASALLMTMLGVLPGHAQKRVALVIGNGAYQHLRPLSNPPNDARDLAKALETLDFDVDLEVDLKLAEMQQKVTDFARRARSADVALAFYAGHGVQAPDPSGSAQPANYLLPVDADIKDVTDLGFLLTARDIVSRLQLAKGIRILILDACRDNPIPQRLSEGRSAGVSRGLGPPVQASGTLIAFSTQPDQTAEDGAGRNSPFIAALLRHISEPGLDVRLLFTDVRADVSRESKGGQTPETWDSLNGRFSFKEADPNALLASTSGGAVPTQATSTVKVPSDEEIAWDYVKDTTDIGSLRRFVARFPAGKRRDEALIRLAALERGAAAGQGAPGKGTPSADAARVPTSVGLLSPERERSLAPPDRFKECDFCPAMVTVPAGSFVMGSPAEEPQREPTEGPQQEIVFRNMFAVGRTAVTFEEWNACVAEGGCNAYRPGDYGWGGGKRPVINVSWNDAQAYVKWLSQKTGATYRLLSEAEREYVTRGCSTLKCPSMPFWFGADISPARANYDWRFSYAGSTKGQPQRRTVATDASESNPFDLLQVHGNVREWVEDCWNANLSGQPGDGTARLTGDCGSRAVRGGSWADEPKDLRSAKRSWELVSERRAQIGFRVARTLHN